ncbi:MAG: hypothetical protein E6R13_04850 [Spirochaetes bacterium]|nr:MAG: hypothetical protein E6R13_04850 [Spirochaetota bacterium]
MISITLFKQGKVLVADAVNSQQKSELFDIIETITSETSVENIINMFDTAELYYVVGDDDIEFEILGSRPGTIKR